ncbi:hypothetical protein [Porphyromonas sp.]|uniref:hypothetical protein n=1 Tax=Porphyromonas sp. TaxID=1924944 RepID=UPI0026DBD4AA|nr:hypothetical protein [Porphyromonas sp.]MDO4771425.1 hypothetical protein [Porphyromonas sp.]
MKEIELNAVGLEPMRKEDAQSTDGGIAPVVALGWFLSACAAGIVADIALSWENTKKQFKEGYDATRN